MAPARNAQRTLGFFLSPCTAWLRNWVAGQLGQAEGLLASFRLYCVFGFHIVLVNLQFQTTFPVLCDAGGCRGGQGVPDALRLPGGFNLEPGGRALGTHLKYVACGGPAGSSQLLTAPCSKTHSLQLPGVS